MTVAPQFKTPSQWAGLAPSNTFPEPAGPHRNKAINPVMATGRSPAISLSARHIVKRYGGVLALADGNLDIAHGEVLALMGANGSGKSTLSKIITGVVTPNEGQILVDGQAVRFANPRAARALGITAVYQELSLIPDLTVAENIWLTHEPLRAGVQVARRAMQARTRALLDLFGGAISPALQPDAPVKALSPGERQIVEILKALSTEPRLMILDEATASLDSQQVTRLFELVKTWKARGMAIVFVSHRMDEIFRVADRATVVRSGKTVFTDVLANTDERALIAQMVGEHALHVTEKTPVSANAATWLLLDKVRAGSIRDVSLTLRAGELLGLGGLQGQGQTDLLLAIFGAIGHAGRITMDGKTVNFSHPAEAMRQSVAFVPGDRGTEGLMLSRSILDNLLLPSWARYGLFLRMDAARRDGRAVTAELNTVMASLEDPVSSLSGGNAQKIVIGKWLMRNPRLLLLNDPTKGVDVSAKSEFYALLARLRANGTAILFYSSDDEELLTLCDRVLVLHDGRIAAELSGSRLTRAELVAASMGAIPEGYRV
jgi:ribose transport system ATP-binding protein